MVLALGLKVRLMSLLWRVKSAFSDFASVCHQLHSPFALMATDTKKAAFVCFSCAFKVLKVSKAINFAQVVKSIVAFLTINMVNMLFRPIASHVQPSKPMSKYFSVVDSNSPIPSLRRRTGFFANQFGLVFVFKPKKIACFRLVTQKLFQLPQRDMVIRSHENEFTIKAI